MKKGTCVAVMTICFVLIAGLSQAVGASVAVSPSPVQFGTVPENSIGYPTLVSVINLTASAVTITGMTVAGTNSGDFAFYGPNCVGTIVANGSCTMYMEFTPLGIGAQSGSLQITVSGQTAAVSAPLLGTGGNPIPTISTISPPTVYEDSPATTVTVNGTGFLSTSIVNWQNLQGLVAPLTTTYVSGTQLKAQVPASAFSQSGADSFYVTNPAPAGGISNWVQLSVIALEPTVGAASPNFVVAGSAPTPIVVSGSNFQSGAKITWNGTAMTTTYISSTQLQATPTTTQLSAAGIIQLAVSNPAPGGLSDPITFNVTYPATVTVLDLPANDMVWDPFAQLIYASIPSSYGVNGNSIAVINPTTGAVTAFHYAGSEPTKLALSADAKYLYVGLNGEGAIQRLALPAFTLDINIPLGTPTSGLQNASDIEVSPASSHTIAVVLTGCCGNGNLEFFTDTTKLANSVTSTSFNSSIFASGTLLYGYSSGTLSKVTVSATGGTLGTQWSGLVYGDAISYASSLIYSAEGQVFNPATGDLEGTFDTGASGCCGTGTQLLSDATIERALVLGTTPFFSSLGITSYNLTEFVPVGVTSLNELGGTPTSAFIQWGSSGLAFTLQNGCCYPTPPNQLVLVQSPTMMLTATKASSPIPTASTLSRTTAAHGTWNFTVNVTGAGFVPGSQITWNGKSRTTKYMSPSQLKLYVPWSDIKAPGTAKVLVKNPTPGGGTATALTFTIE